MEFHWHKENCLPAEEWKTIAVCMQQNDFVKSMHKEKTK